MVREAVLEGKVIKREQSVGNERRNMKNPLRKRLLREVKEDLGKYVVIFLLLVLSIGFVSGFMVAGSSMALAYDDGFEKYNIENGNFRVGGALTEKQKERIERSGLTLYDNFYVEKGFDNDTKLRIFGGRNEVDKICVMDGRLPENDLEIAVDRMYADNNNLSVGDVLTVDSAKSDSTAKTEDSYKIVGLVALSDYSALFYNNNDMMFDASAFGVAVVSDSRFSQYDEDSLYYNYAWKYENEPKNDIEEKEVSDKLMEKITAVTDLESFTPRYLNQAITFTGEDIVSDKAMVEVLLYIIIIIVAFVFAITINNTIHKEANVIGTLRASGYTINELIVHYMTMPLVVTIISAIIGNICGYTFFKEVCASIYYGSYSLPTYVTIWSGETFFKTTLIPIFIMCTVTYFMLRSKLSISPLKLIRRDLSGKKQTHAVKLPKRINFLERFRIRVLIQNRSSYMTLFAGLFFANLLLFFGMMLPPLMVHFQETVTDTMLAKYTYILQVPAGALDTDNMVSSTFSYIALRGKVNTNNKDAEKFSACTLKTTGEDGVRVEEVTLYGVKEKSRYIHAEFDDKTVLVSSAYADKYGLKEGDVITLKEPYDEKYYGFKVTGVYDYDGGVAVFMSQSHLNGVLGYDDEFFAGYFSDSEITDIDEKYIGTVINEEALTRVSRQLMISMGKLMYLVDGFSVLLFIVLMYLLSKLIIERNAQSISMVKILGYSKKEIALLYIVPTALVVVVSILISYGILTNVMVWIFREMLKRMMSGWLMIWLDPKVYVEMFLLGVCTYAIVAIIEYFRIGRISMSDALKNVE